MDYGTDFIEHPSIRAIIHNKVEKETLNFELVNSSQVDLLLSSINSRKSCGHDMLHPTLLKLSAPVIALPVHVKNHQLLNHLVFLSGRVENGPSNAAI